MSQADPQALFVSKNKDGDTDLVNGTLRPGAVYTLDVPYFIPDLALSLDYLDERIVRSFIKKIRTGKELPLVAFTDDGLRREIVSGIHVVVAAINLDIPHIKGIYVPRSALDAKRIEQIFF